MSRQYSINKDYKIFIQPDMQEYLNGFKEIDKNIFKQLKSAIMDLKENPHRNKILADPKNRRGKKRHSARAGDYRIIYEVADNKINILLIGNRNSVYKEYKKLL